MMTRVIDATNANPPHLTHVPKERRGRFQARRSPAEGRALRPYMSTSYRSWHPGAFSLRLHSASKSLALAVLIMTGSACSAGGETPLGAPSPVATGQAPATVGVIEASSCKLSVEAIPAPAGAGNRCWFRAHKLCAQAAAELPTWSVRPDVYLEVLTSVDPPTPSEDGRGPWAYIAGHAGTYRVTAIASTGEEITVRAVIGDGVCKTAPKK